MKFRDFVSWCNERTCDGCWGIADAMICIAAIQEVNKVPFWKRKKKWGGIGGEIVESIVEPTNKMIAETFQ